MDNIRTLSPPAIECKEKRCWHCGYRGVSGVCGKFEVCLLFIDPVTRSPYPLKMDDEFCLLRCKPCLEQEQLVLKPVKPKNGSYVDDFFSQLLEQQRALQHLSPKDMVAEFFAYLLDQGVL